jgi:endogenous inhibitor of DNA gyrase (YacG/DUF329 family)
MRYTCPGCKEEQVASRRKEAPDFPFCSPRCRMGDLDRWFTEDYQVPGEHVDGMPAEGLIEGP